MASFLSNDKFHWCISSHQKPCPLRAPCSTRRTKAETSYSTGGTEAGAPRSSSAEHDKIIGGSTGTRYHYGYKAFLLQPQQIQTPSRSSALHAWERTATILKDCLGKPRPHAHIKPMIRGSFSLSHVLDDLCSRTRYMSLSVPWALNFQVIGVAHVAQE